VDCTPKRIAAKNVETYRRRGLKFILQGGEKHSTTGHSFVAESNYASALGRDATRVVSCNTTSVVRTLTALKRAGLLRRARGAIQDANQSIDMTNAALGVETELVSAPISDAAAAATPER
jgi:hypothetical protein